jgi:hypothetical protein
VLGDRLGVERGVPAREHYRILVAPLPRRQRDAGQVKRGQQVRIAQFGGEAHTQHVEGAHRPVGLDRELGHPVFPHELFQVMPHAVGAFREYPVAFVQYLVENLQALVGNTDLIGVRVHQSPADLRGIPVLDH